MRSFQTILPRLGAILAVLALAGCVPVNAGNSAVLTPGAFATAPVTATQEPSALPTPTAPATTQAIMPAPTPQESEMPTITLADNDKTLTFHVGQHFLLALSESYDWTISIDNQSVVSRVVNVLAIRGTQGLFEAHKPGRTILTAVGDPPCRKAQPACAAPSRLFRLNVIVQ